MWETCLTCWVILPFFSSSQGSSGPDDIFEEDSYSPSSLSSSTSSIPPLKSVCTSCGQDIVDRYLLKVTLTMHGSCWCFSLCYFVLQML